MSMFDAIKKLFNREKEQDKTVIAKEEDTAMQTTDKAQAQSSERYVPETYACLCGTCISFKHDFRWEYQNRPNGASYEIQDKKGDTKFYLDVNYHVAGTPYPLKGFHMRRSYDTGIEHDIREDLLKKGKLQLDVSLTAKKGDVEDDTFRYKISAVQNNSDNDNRETTDVRLMLYNNIKDAVNNDKNPQKQEAAKLINRLLEMVDDPIMNAPNLKRIEKLQKGIKLHNGTQGAVHSEEDLQENRKNVRYRKSDAYKQEQEQQRLAKAEKDTQDKQFLSKAVRNLKALFSNR